MTDGQILQSDAQARVELAESGEPLPVRTCGRQDVDAMSAERYRWGWPQPEGWTWLGSTDDEDEAYRAMQSPNVEAYDTVERRWLVPEPWPVEPPSRGQAPSTENGESA